jgi:uncharacterized membrane protein YeaQ/YmgE (transglycosylase-associated protein family)
MQSYMKSQPLAAKMMRQVQAQEIRASRILGGITGTMVAIAIYVVAYASHAGGLTAMFVAGIVGAAVFQMFEPIFNTSS